MTHGKNSINQQSETKKRLLLLNKIAEFVNDTSLTGLLVTGSIAWGKNHAVHENSDIDFYLIAPGLKDFEIHLSEMNFFPKESLKVIQKLLKYKEETMNTRSLKTTVGNFHGAIYFFTEKQIRALSNKLNDNKSKFFKNLRPIAKPQTKTYVGFDDNQFVFTTPIKKLNLCSLWLRTDPVVLINDHQFYGSIFLSHLLYGDIYVDKNGCLAKCRSLAAKSLKSRLSEDRKIAFEQFISYLPRSERMSKETIKIFFKDIWRIS